MPPRKRGRDAVSGRFISLLDARRRPWRTVVETVKAPARKKVRRTK